MEPFHYSFPDKMQHKLEVLPIREEVCRYVLFDYEQRDPLDHQAKVILLDIEEGEACDEENKGNIGQVR